MMTRYQINLISSRRKEKPLDRLVYFSLYYLRYVLIITQMVVIFVFLYKFSVDQKIVDLQETLSQKQEIVKVSSPLIKEARAADFAINQIKSLISSQENYSAMMKYLFSEFPAALTLDKFDYEEESIVFSGSTANVQVLKSYYSRLKKEAKFKKINLKSITKSEGRIGFAFELLDFAP